MGLRRSSLWRRGFVDGMKSGPSARVMDNLTFQQLYTPNHQVITECRHHQVSTITCFAGSYYLPINQLYTYPYSCSDLYR